MSKNILLSSPQITAAISTAQIASRLIDTDREIWVSQGENSIALDAFAHQYEALQSAVTLYQTLLLKDLKAARNVHNELVRSELSVSNLWK